MVEKTDNFATRFEALRDGMSFQALSDAIHRRHGKRISPQGMHKWAKGGKIEPENLRLIADFFGVNEAWLMYGSGPQARGSTLEDAVAALGADDGQAVLDFFRYKIERADHLIASEHAAHYVTMIERMKQDMEEKRRAEPPDEKKP